MVDPLLGGAIGVALLIVFTFSGTPICISLLFSGIIGLFLIGGITEMSPLISSAIFEQLFSVGILAVPMFVLMGNIIAQHGMGADLYTVAHMWLGRLPGGLAIASTVMSALFGFMCGSGVAGTATIGSVAIPEMESRRYDRRLSLGTLALAGGLSALIPPSILMIIYAMWAKVSLGWLFFAGIFPGLLLMTLMSVYIFIRAGLDPKIAPKGESFPVRRRILSLVHLGPVLILFLVVLGGIYMGIWSPTEAGGGGCLIALLIALAYRRISWSSIRVAVFAALKTSGMIYMLVAGAATLALMFYMSGLSKMIELTLVGLAIPAWGIVLIILFTMMILGMFMDVMALLLIMVPISLPIVLALGYDPIWWGIIIITSCEMAMITPPVGIHLFVIQGIAPKGTTLMDVAWGAAPFVGILWLLIGLMIAFPEIAMWLPSTVKG